MKKFTILILLSVVMLGASGCRKVDRIEIKQSQNQPGQNKEGNSQQNLGHVCTGCGGTHAPNEPTCP